MYSMKADGRPPGFLTESMLCNSTALWVSRFYPGFTPRKLGWFVSSCSRFLSPPPPFFLLSSRFVHSSVMLRHLVASGNRTTWLSERNYTVGFKHHKYLGWHNKNTWLHSGKHSDPGPNVIQVIIHHSLLLERKVTHPKHLIHAPQPSHCVSNLANASEVNCGIVSHQMFQCFFSPSEPNLEMFFIYKPLFCV